MPASTGPTIYDSVISFIVLFWGLGARNLAGEVWQCLPFETIEKECEKIAPFERVSYFCYVQSFVYFLFSLFALFYYLSTGNITWWEFFLAVITRTSLSIFAVFFLAYFVVGTTGSQLARRGVPLYISFFTTQVGRHCLSSFPETSTILTIVTLCRPIFTTLLSNIFFDVAILRTIYGPPSPESLERIAAKGRHKNMIWIALAIYHAICLINGVMPFPSLVTVFFSLPVVQEIFLFFFLWLQFSSVLAETVFEVTAPFVRYISRIVPSSSPGNWLCFLFLSCLGITGWLPTEHDDLITSLIRCGSSLFFIAIFHFMPKPIAFVGMLVACLLLPAIGSFIDMRAWDSSMRFLQYDMRAWVSDAKVSTVTRNANLTRSAIAQQRRWLGYWLCVFSGWVALNHNRTYLIPTNIMLFCLALLHGISILAGTSYVLECLNLQNIANALTAPRNESPLSMLANESTTVAQMRAVFGDGIEGSMMAIAHQVTFKTKCWVYGGFLRDFVIGGKAHSEMDLDIGLPDDGSLTAPAAMQLIEKFASASGLRLKGRVNKGHHVEAAEFFCFNGRTTMNVEVVDSQQWGASVDFDVSNLKLVVAAGAKKAHLALKYPNQPVGWTVGHIITNIRARKMVNHKPLDEIGHRLEKMEKRGWKLKESKGWVFWSSSGGGGGKKSLPWPSWKDEDIGKDTTYESVPRGSLEWKHVEDEWRGVSSAPGGGPKGARNALTAYTIESIERVQNAAAWDFYKNTRETIAKLSNAKASDSIEVRANEWLLKHGTRTVSPKDICNKKQGLNITYASRGMYGQAIYTAEKASYSDSVYAYKLPNGNKQMLLVKVSAGRIWSAPNPYDASLSDSKEPPRQYDSIRGPVTSGSSPDFAIMIYECHRTYPQYIITYK